MASDDAPSSLTVSVGDVTVRAAPREGAAGADPDWSFSGKLRVMVDGQLTVVRVDLSVVVARARDVGRDTFLGAPHAAHVERLSGEPVAAVTMNKGGTGLSFRLDLQQRSRGLYKPEQTNAWSSPRKEVAAYRIARALGINGVPPCTMRSLHRDDLIGKLVPTLAFLAPRIERETVFDASHHTHGSAAVWVPDLVDSRLDTLVGQRLWKQWLTIGNAIPEEDIALAAQVSSMIVLDRLTDNSDRFTGGGVLSSRWRNALLDRQLHRLRNGSGRKRPLRGVPRALSKV